jgi:hypothetical protein
MSSADDLEGKCGIASNAGWQSVRQDVKGFPRYRSQPLIIVVLTSQHAYTHSRINEYQSELDIRPVPYDQVVGKDPEKATYIFTDFDRLPNWRLQDAALHYRRLQEAGVKVFNDPARVDGRYGLLRRLSRRGINDFDSYRVEELAMPKRWPVFLRMEGNHAPPLSGLLDNVDQLRKATRLCIKAGYPIGSLLIVEYAAEPVRPGLYRRLSVFRIGDRMLGHTCAHDDNWIVKYGKTAIAPEELYEEEYEMIRDDSFGEALRPAFVLAGVQYGRADFGLIGGKPQIYEINTNPEVALSPKPSPIQRRNESFALFREKYIAAMREIDTPA